MSMYYPGYREAQATVARMNEQELLAQLDALYGRDNLPENYTIDELRIEAYEQVKRDFTDTSSKEYQDVQFWTKVHKAGGIR